MTGCRTAPLAISRDEAITTRRYHATRSFLFPEKLRGMPVGSACISLGKDITHFGTSANSLSLVSVLPSVVPCAIFMFGLKVSVLSRNELTNIEIKCSVICWEIQGVQKQRNEVVTVHYRADGFETDIMEQAALGAPSTHAMGDCRSFP